MKLIVDRLEGNLAVCETEDKKILNIPVSEFESRPADGDVIEYDNERAIVLKEETKRRKRAAEEFFRKLLKK